MANKSMSAIWEIPWRVEENFIQHATDKSGAALRVAQVMSSQPMLRKAYDELSTG